MREGNRPASDGGGVRPLDWVADAARLLDLNDAEVPAVGPLGDLSVLEDYRRWVDVALGSGRPVDAFAWALLPGGDYPSPNYRWFSARFENFVYLDRVCVAPSARGRGLGRLLYTEVETRVLHLRPDTEWFLAEVNTRPANRPSLAFHFRFGFEEVGRAQPYSDGIEVAYLARRIPRPGDSTHAGDSADRSSRPDRGGGKAPIPR